MLASVKIIKKQKNMGYGIVSSTRFNSPETVRTKNNYNSQNTYKNNNQVFCGVQFFFTFRLFYFI